MKVLVLSHISDIVGGAEMSMLDIFDDWNKKYDIDPVFILRKPIKKLARALDDRGWKYHELDYGFWSESNPSKNEYDMFKNGLMNARAVKSIKKIIADEKPDVVMTNSVVSPWAAIAAHFAQVPHVWFVREYGDLDHGRVFENGREKTLQDVGTLSTLVAANSETLAQHYEQYVPKEKMRVIYTPFSLLALNEKANARVKNPFTSGEIKLAVTGSLAVSKGQLEAIEAIGRLKQAGIEAELCLIGGNPSDEFTQKKNALMNKYGIENQVHFVGFQENPLAYVKHADVCVMSSRREAFGRVTFEYIAIGKPVIGSNSGATPEMVHDEENGFLYDQGDVEGLVNAIKRYHEQPQLLKEHGVASKRIAAEMMNGEHSSDKLFGEITQMLKNPTMTPAVSYLTRNLDYLEAARIYSEKQAKNPLSYARPTLRSIAKRGYHKVVRLKTRLRSKS